MPRVHVFLPEGTLESLDRLLDGRSRSAWIARVVEQALGGAAAAGSPGVHVPPAPAEPLEAPKAFTDRPPSRSPVSRVEMFKRATQK